jgi:pyruvate kinase
LLDTRGPEIRTGKLANDISGHDTVQFKKDATVTLQTNDKSAELVAAGGSTEQHLFIDFAALPRAVSPGSKVLLDDGAISLTVVECNPTLGTVECHIDNSGHLRSRAGVNLPFADTSSEKLGTDALPALSAKDKDDILYGMSVADIDYIAASFVQNAAGVHEIRQHVLQCAKKLGWNPADPSKPLPLIISKIETASALSHFDEILAASDGIMVARGDLGVEIPLQQVTNAQKEMIYACNAAGKVRAQLCIVKRRRILLSKAVLNSCSCILEILASDCGHANAGKYGEESTSNSCRSF